MNKIKLSPEQEAFAREIGATHYDSTPDTWPFLKKKSGEWLFYLESMNRWLIFGYKISSEIREIDFTSEQEPDYKAIATELKEQLQRAHDELSRFDSAYGLKYTHLKYFKRAIQRAKDAGL